MAERPTPRRIVVVGCGHVGLVTAAGFAHMGHMVTGIDKSPELIVALRAERVPFHEEGLSELVGTGLSSGRLLFTTSYQESVANAEFIFLAVDTPTTPGGGADLRNIRAAAHSIAAAIGPTNPIIVNKSTSPVGTGEIIEGILLHNLVDSTVMPRVVSNPEFLRQGHAVQDFFHPDRIVIGAHSTDDAMAVSELYRGLDSQLVITGLRTAEMIKYVANSFLATRVSFINEVARLCDALAVSVDEVLDGVAHDARIGRRYFSPGIGFGGGCLPKDIAALRYMGERLGVPTPVLQAVEQVNLAQRTSAVRALRAALGDLEGQTVAVWGLTFKGNTEDVRESPAMDVIGLLLNEGAIVRLYDPSQPHELVPARLREFLHRDPIEAARNADALAVLTDWSEFRTIPLEQVSGVMRGRVLFDGRNLLDPDEAETSGFRYIGIGRPRPAKEHLRVAETAAAR